LGRPLPCMRMGGPWNAIFYHVVVGGTAILQ
jgi:hypothetical protein